MSESSVYTPGMFRERRLATVRQITSECLQTNTKALSLWNMRLPELPVDMGDLKDLTSLNLGFYGLTSIHEAIGELTKLKDLRLQGNYLVSLPESIFKLKNLTRLDIGFCRLGSLPEEIGALQNLTSLDVSGNYLKSLPSGMAELKNLTSLSLSGNTLETFPEWLSELKNLTSFNISVCGLETLPEWIGELRNLTSLSLSGNRLTSLPEWISELKNLTSLDVSGNRLTSLPESLSELKNLTSLDVSRNNLRSLPKLKSLTRLNMSYCGITRLPVWITELENLFSLDVSYCKIKFESSSIQMAELINLKEINLGNNYLESLPEWLSKLKNLINLNISGNLLESIPESLSELKNLTSLDIGGNLLESLPESLSELKNLTSLDISGNPLESLPEWLSELKNLTSLDISGILLESLPESLSELKNLRSLNISGNLLESLPEWLSKLNHLTSLVVSRNRLTSLPKCLAEFKSLASLFADDNDLKSFPETLATLPLYFLSLSGNPKLNLDSSLSGITDPDFLFEALFSRDRVPLNEVRLIILGEPGVGKSSTKNWLLYGKEIDTDQTDKIEIDPWLLKIDDKDVTVRIWDFGGQDIYQASHQFFLSDRSLYILLLSSRIDEAKNEVDKWVETIRTYGQNSQVMVVVNHEKTDLDLRRNRIREALGEDRVKFVDINAKTGEGVVNLVDAIKDSIRSMDTLKSTLPRTWVNLKDSVVKASEARPYLDLSEYQSLCQGLEITEGVRPAMLDALDNLGLALKYRADKGLLILNPQWIINGVYKLLSAPKEGHQNGVMTKEVAFQIIKDSGCSYDQLSFIFGFMVATKLAVQIPYDPHHSILIPDLSRSELEKLPSFEESTSIVIRFDQLLAGLMPRLIVSEYDAISADQYWKTGFIAVYRESRVIFDLRTRERELWITVEGNSQRSREALYHSLEIVLKLQKVEPYRNVKFSLLVPIKGHPGELVDLESLETAESMGHEFHAEKKIQVDVKQHLGGVKTSNQLSYTQMIVNTQNAQISAGENAKFTQEIPDC